MQYAVSYGLNAGGQEASPGRKGSPLQACDTQWLHPSAMISQCQPSTITDKQCITVNKQLLSRRAHVDKQMHQLVESEHSYTVFFSRTASPQALYISSSSSDTFTASLTPVDNSSAVTGRGPVSLPTTSRVLRWAASCDRPASLWTPPAYKRHGNTQQGMQRTYQGYNTIWYNTRV